jgi:hypothetical protein
MMSDVHMLVTWDCTCGRCGDQFQVTTECGPSQICARCARVLWMIATRQAQVMRPVFPIAGDATKCGLRTDMPKAMRRHLFADMGLDTRNMGAGGFTDRRILACVRCGMDRHVDPDVTGPFRRPSWI